VLRAMRKLPRLVAVIAIVVVAVVAITSLPDLNPFGSETIDRSGPAVLKSIERLSEYRAATANLEVIVDIEEDANLLPSFIKGEKVLFVAAGRVDAFVGFDDPRVKVDEGRRSATITLQPPRLADAAIDLDRSRVYDRDRGLLDRVESVFEDSPTTDQELIALAQDKLEAAANADESLRTAAEDNTRQMLEGLLTGLGFESVTVTFESGASPAD
jgi:hypothetical protein